MRICLILSGLSAAVMLMPPSPSAAYTAKGFVECPKLIEEDANPNYRQMNKFWLLGYITARNYENDASVGDSIDDESLYLLALEFCRRNPQADLDDAAIDIYDRLR